ncbi:hypothetical protein R6Q59_029900 [Mikania micrantha]
MWYQSLNQHLWLRMMKMWMRPRWSLEALIELVKTQADVSKPKVVKALKAADGDIVRICITN